MSKDFIVNKNPFILKFMLFILHDTVAVLKLLDSGFETRKQSQGWLKGFWFEWLKLLAFETEKGNMNKGAVLLLFCIWVNGMDNHLSVRLVAVEVLGRDVW